jgi:mitogen-activated protein kinase kinase 7
MQMPPPPPPSSSSDGGYLGIPAMSNRLKALEEKILRQIGPIDSPTTPTGNRATSRNINLQTRQIPTSLIGSSPSRASSAPPTRKGVFHLPLSPLQPTTNNTSDYTQAKYQEVLKNSGLLHINGEQKRVELKELANLSILGYGSCGQVYKMEHTSSKTELAVKIMHRTASDEENKRIIMDLDVIIKSYNFPYIVKCVGYFINSSDVWICMELMSSCFDKLLKLIQQPIPENVLGKLTFATVTALNYLKDAHGIIHRDVKPSNILIDEYGTIKLCDFGISGVLIESMAKSRNAGCAAYMSPERIEPSDPTRPDYDIRADIWSLGITLIELATNAYPYSNCRSDFDVMSRIVTENSPQLPAHLSFSDHFRSFVDMCLIKNYKQRPKYGELMLQPFFIQSHEQPVDVAGWYRDITGAAMEKQRR